MHGGFGGGGGGGFGHGGGGGGFHHSGGGGGHSNVSGHMTSGHEHHGGGGHAAHAAHNHHHGGGGKDDKKVHAQSKGHAQTQGHNQGHNGAQTQGQSTLSHLTSLVQNGHGVLGHIAAALSGHNTTSGHGAGAGQSMHLAQYLSPLQAEKTDSSDQVGNPGALSHPDNLVQTGMVSRRTHNEPRILLAAIFAGLLIWMLVVQLFSGGPPTKHKQITSVTPKGRPLSMQEGGAGADPEQEMAKTSSVAPLLSLLSMAESHGGKSIIGQALSDDPNSDPNEATQNDDARIEQKERPDTNDQADMQGESSADVSSGADSSAQMNAAMSLFQPSAGAGTQPGAQGVAVAPSAMMAQAPQMGARPRSPLRAISNGVPMSARMTARPMGNPRAVTTDGPVPQVRTTTSNMLQAEDLQKGAQETFAAGSFGGPRALTADEPIIIGAQSKVPGASSILRVQKPGSQPTPSPTPQLISVAPDATSADPASFANLFVPANNAPNVVPPKHASEPGSTSRRRWKSASQGTVRPVVVSARNSTIADASIYTNSPVDEFGHSRKRVLTDR